MRLTDDRLIDLHPTFSPFNKCDFDSDGDVDFNDFAILASAWGTIAGHPMWIEKCDVSEPKDGIIDWLDLRVFCDNWLKGK